MTIGILSDTHDQVALAGRAVEVLRAARPERVYHLGDWCSPFMLGLFATLPCPVISIFGNNDADIFKMTRIRPDNLHFKDRFFVDQLHGKQIALIHGDPEELVHAVVESGRYGLVLRGHNHVAQIQRTNQTLVINPGSLVGPTEAFPHWTPPSLALYDTETDEAQLVALR